MSSNQIAFRQLTTNTSHDARRRRGMNSISTTKYTWYSWLPKSLWEQFRRIANIYFLVISVMMLVGTYAKNLYDSPLDPFSTVLTLIFVLLVTSFKEGSEDLQRARSDRYENLKKVIVITFKKNNNNEYVEVETIKKSRDVHPGDIIKLKGKTAVPVDMLLLLTSNYKDGNKCFIETANIDGETNLKVREAPAALFDTLTEETKNTGKVEINMFSGELEFEVPNKNIHNFVGTYKLSKDNTTIPLTADNILLRSSVFSNTDWAYGIAVYTGKDTKIQMNNRQVASKMSKLEGKLNTAIIIIFIAQILLVTASVISIYLMGFDDVHKKLPYVYPPSDEDQSILPLWLEQWFVFFLLYNNFIPISLYVTIELVNMGQAMLIQGDEKIYNEDLDVACVVRNSDLVQELGQVSNIFSDKTGTLTRNEMKLVKFVINGSLYDIEDTIRVNKTESSSYRGNDLNQVPVDYERLYNGFSTNKSKFKDFCELLITCHTVVKEETGELRAESPDELALVEGSFHYNCDILERGRKDLTVKVCGENKTFEVLAVNPFNSDRKRMSVLLLNKETNEYILYCKGADNIMIPLCKNSPSDIESINSSLLDLANLGLRTLILAKKVLTESEAKQWLTEYNAAIISTVNREENIAAAGSKIEVEMETIGITAIEDRLQDEVPQVIADLSKAGIIVWMLTGDKLETAISIGRSCNLLLSDTKLFMLTKIQSTEEFAFALENVYNELLKIIDEKTLDDIVSGSVSSKESKHALVIDGPSFTYFNPNSYIQKKQLLALGKSSRSVIACRLTPTQKRELVRLVRKASTPPSFFSKLFSCFFSDPNISNEKKPVVETTTLAIGDGANDVSMILEADVGIGIFGKEGRQAANNANFAIGEFKFLRRLLLVHGRWNYIRQSRVFLYSMHKNMVITLTLFWYSYYTAISGTSHYQSYIYTAFNFILGLPIIMYGIFDRDLSEDFVLAHPQVYVTSKLNRLLDLKTILAWIFNAILYTIILCAIYFITYAPSMSYEHLYYSGTLMFTSMCMGLQLKVLFFHHQIAYPHFMVMLISVVGMLLFYAFVSYVSWDFYYVGIELFYSGNFWIGSFIVVPFLLLMLDGMCYYFISFFSPTEETYFRELELQQWFSGFRIFDFSNRGQGINSKNSPSIVYSGSKTSLTTLLNTMESSDSKKKKSTDVRFTNNPMNPQGPVIYNSEFDD